MGNRDPEKPKEKKKKKKTKSESEADRVGLSSCKSRLLYSNAGGEWFQAADNGANKINIDIFLSDSSVCWMTSATGPLCEPVSI